MCWRARAVKKMEKKTREESGYIEASDSFISSDSNKVEIVLCFVVAL